MSTENNVLRITLPAYEDLSDYQYQFVVLNSSGQVKLMDTAIERPIGILQNEPTANQAAEVMVIGQSKLVANDAIAVGTFIKPEFVSVTDCGKGQDCGCDRGRVLAMVMESSSAEDDLLSVELLYPHAGGMGTPISATVVSTITTAGAATYTAAQVLGGLILRDPSGASRSDVTPTAALIIAAIPGASAGDSFEFIVRNDADAAETITVTAGTDVTLSGTMTIAQTYAKRFRCVVTAATTVTIYSLGTVVY